MPFDYLHPDVNPKYTEATKANAEKAHLQAIKERAAMLHRLGYSKEDAIRRLEQNVEWDFDKWADRLPSFYEQITAIVEQIYRRKP